MKKTVLAAVLVSAVAAFGAATGCRGGNTDNAVEVTDGEVQTALESTPWLDKAPESPTDNFSAYVFQKGEGAFVTGNQYRGTWDMFRYRLNETNLEFRFLADGKTAKSKIKLEHFDNGPFGYRLTIKDAPRGPKVYYGFDNHHSKDVPVALKQVVDNLAKRTH
ncbi:MAG TPA: hypothetical protein PLF40_00095 [Kofleriaceae bacterium]|nr:hypothetical protein [Kofleriaceae bacterium]